jgi:hypothetical protein
MDIGGMSKKEVRFIRIVVDRCGVCQFRHGDKDVADGTIDPCSKTGRNMGYANFLSRGAFPQFCPLPKK